MVAETVETVQCHEVGQQMTVRLHAGGRDIIAGMKASGGGPDALLYVGRKGAAWKHGVYGWRVESSVWLDAVGVVGQVTRRELEAACKRAGRHVSPEVPLTLVDAGQGAPDCVMDLAGAEVVPWCFNYDLVQALRTVRGSVSDDETRPVLCGVCVRPRPGGGVYVEATNTYQLARVEVDGVDIDGGLSEEESFILPADVVDWLTGPEHGAASVRYNGGWWYCPSFSGGGHLAFRTIYGQWPNFDKVLPSSAKAYYLADALKVGDVGDWATRSCNVPCGTIGGEWCEVEDRDCSDPLELRVRSPWVRQAGRSDDVWAVDLRRLGCIARSVQPRPALVKGKVPWHIAETVPHLVLMHSGGLGPAVVSVEGRPGVTFALMGMLLE